MTWNWQQPDWPTFIWERSRLEAAEQQFLVGGGVFVGTAKHLGSEQRDQLTIESMSTEAVTTPGDEQGNLDRDRPATSNRTQMRRQTANRPPLPPAHGLHAEAVRL